MIRNRRIIAEMTYGVQSEGRLRRFTQEGPRTLTDGDLREDEKPKVIRNDDVDVVRVSIGFEPSVDIELFESCQRKLQKRGEHQRGISRRRNPSKYSLALKIFDVSDEFGYPLYAVTSENRPHYVCSRYMNTSGQACNHNAVDGEAALRFTLNFLRVAVERVGGRDALKAKLDQIAERERTRSSDESCQDASLQLEAKTSAAKTELALIKRNLARASNDEEYSAIRNEFESQQKDRCAT